MYQFMLSNNLGISYSVAHESEDLDDPQFSALADMCNEKLIRCYIVQDGEIVSGRWHSGVTPYQQRPISSMVADLKAHFSSN